MFELTFFIPLADNDGQPFTSEDYAAWEGAILRRFEGLTLIEESGVSGLWVSHTGRVDSDKHRLYILAVQGIKDMPKVLLLACWARRHFRQEAITVRYLGQMDFI